jgi:phospholipid-translocating ATPase
MAVVCHRRFIQPRCKVINSNRGQTPGETFAQGVVKHFHDATLQADIENSVNADPGSEQTAHARLLNGFSTVPSLCHTVLTVVDPETNKIEYKAQSPDEAVLVQAAAEVGYVFRARDREILKLQTPFSDELESC